jgi:hypothetical protein
MEADMEWVLMVFLSWSDTRNPPSAPAPSVIEGIPTKALCDKAKADVIAQLAAQSYASQIAYSRVICIQRK